MEFCPFTRYAHPHILPTVKWDIFPPSPRPNEIFFSISSQQPSGIYFLSPFQSIGNILPLECCFFRSNTVFNSEGIALCYLHLSSLSRMNYCILVCWRSNEHYDILINPNNMSSKEKEPQRFLGTSNTIIYKIEYVTNDWSCSFSKMKY